MPHEVNFGEVYLPPLVVVSILALILAWLTAKVLNRLRWTRFVVAPTLVFLSMTAIYMVVIGTFIVLV